MLDADHPRLSVATSAAADDIAGSNQVVAKAMGSEKSADGRSDKKIWDELSVATFATVVVDTGDADGGAGPADGAVSADGGEHD